MPKLQKEIILGAVMTLLGVFSWYFLKYVFYIGNLTLTCWLGGIALFVFWGIFLCLAMLLIDNRKILYGSFIIILIAFGMFFNNEPFYYFIGMLILLIAFGLAVWKIRQEEKVQVNLNFWRIWKRGFPFLVTALILVIALVYYFSPMLEQVNQREIRLPRKIFDVVIEALSGLIEERLPEGIDSLDVEAGKILTPEEINELEIRYNIEIKEGETAKDFLYKLVNFQINNVRGPYKKYIPIGLAITLFLVLRAVAVVYIAFVVLFSWLVLELLIALKFVKTELEPKEVETVKL